MTPQADGPTDMTTIQPITVNQTTRQRTQNIHTITRNRQTLRPSNHVGIGEHMQDQMPIPYAKHDSLTPPGVTRLRQNVIRFAYPTHYISCKRCRQALPNLRKSRHVAKPHFTRCRQALPD